MSVANTDWGHRPYPKNTSIELYFFSDVVVSSFITGPTALLWGFGKVLVKLAPAILDDLQYLLLCCMLSSRQGAP